jgi:hypothetical protein
MSIYIFLISVIWANQLIKNIEKAPTWIIFVTPVMLIAGICGIGGFFPFFN